MLSAFTTSMIKVLKLILLFNWYFQVVIGPPNVVHFAELDITLPSPHTTKLFN